MTPFDIARSYLGETEGPGSKNNPKIIEMYASVGHEHIAHDDVAWCAAFVGHCLERAGIRSTRALTARSYLQWGIAVAREDAQQGDIGVLPRGTSSWQGHVFFIDRIQGGWVWGLGGNQGDAVSIKRYPVSKLLGIRRAGNVDPALTLTVKDVQTRLKALGYHEVGRIDGILGPRTRGAILAFRDDQNLPREAVIDVALGEALSEANPRIVAPERRDGLPEGSRILRASHRQMGLSALGVGSVISADLAPIIADAERAQGILGRLSALFGDITWVETLMPWIGSALFIFIMISAAKARHARIEDHRSGKTP